MAETVPAAQARQLEAVAMRTWSVALPGLPDWNRYGGNVRHGHYMAEHRAFKEIKRNIVELIDVLAKMPEAPFERYSLSYTFRSPGVRTIPRDWDNIMRATKPITDALVELGILRDDSRKYMPRPPELWVEKAGKEEQAQTIIVVQEVTP